MSHLGLSQLFDFINLFIGQEVQEADNVRAVPFILLFNGLQQQMRVPVAILVTAEKMAASCFVLEEKLTKGLCNKHNLGLSKMMNTMLQNLVLNI